MCMYIVVRRLKKQCAFTASGAQFSSTTRAWLKGYSTHAHTLQVEILRIHHMLLNPDYLNARKRERERCYGICHPSWSQIHHLWILWSDTPWTRVSSFKTAGVHITPAQDPGAPWESDIIYLRITVSAKVKTLLKTMIQMTLFNDLPPFLPLSSPAPGCVSSFLPLFHASWVKCTRFPLTSLSSAFAETVWMFRGWNVFSWPIFFSRKVCVRRAKRAKLLTRRAVCAHNPFQNSPPPSLSYFLPPSTFLLTSILLTCTFPPPYFCQYSRAAGNLIKQGVS